MPDRPCGCGDHRRPSSATAAQGRLLISDVFKSSAVKRAFLEDVIKIVSKIAVEHVGSTKARWFRRAKAMSGSSAAPHARFLGVPFAYA